MSEWQSKNITDYRKKLEQCNRKIPEIAEMQRYILAHPDLNPVYSDVNFSNMIAELEALKVECEFQLRI